MPDSLHPDSLQRYYRTPVKPFTSRSTGLTLLCLALPWAPCASGGQTGAGNPICQNAVAHVSQPSVRLGGTVTFTTTSNIGPLTNGLWEVGAWAQGNLDQDGTFHTPGVVPMPNVTHATYYFGSGNCAPTVSLTLLNATPTISATWPLGVEQLSTPITIIGSNFMATSVLLVNGTSTPFWLNDPGHMNANITLTKPVSGLVSIRVINPDPGSSSVTVTIPAVFPKFSVITPRPLVGGPNALTITGSGFTWQTTLTFDGRPLPLTLVSGTKLTANVFVAPWRTGTIPIAVQPVGGGASSASWTLPIQATAIPFDVAARFSTQAAFGPRPGVVQQIQRSGLAGFLSQQMSQPAVAYTLPGWYSARSQYMRAALYGSSLLRLRVATALGSFIVNTANNYDYGSYAHWELILENGAFGNFRTLLTNITADPGMGRFLNLAGNNASPDPNLHPNQNYARELMQLFTLGPVLLNDDGTMQVDATGRPKPSYDQATLLDLSRALTGWNYATPVDPNFTVQGIDYSQPLVGREDMHEHGTKTLFGTVTLAAGQGTASDRAKALDAIFAHPNLPPFVSRILIQRLVKSNPTPAYVARVGAVFKNDGHGVRGDMAAVVRAILLDPEARAGDAGTVEAEGGFLQEPLLFELFAANSLEQDYPDNQATFIPAEIGESFWYAPSVNGFYAPAGLIPGTSVGSPEFSLLNNLSQVQRSQILYGMVSGTLNAFGNDYMNRSWLYQSFTNVPDLVDGLNHLLYHGTMPAATRSAILSYCATLDPADLRTQFTAAIFLALNSDAFNVVQ